jgi:hypothetical protein
MEDGVEIRELAESLTSVAVGELIIGNPLSGLAIVFLIIVAFVASYLSLRRYVDTRLNQPAKSREQKAKGS